MDLTDELVSQLADGGRSAAQKNAIQVALMKLRELMQLERDMGPAANVVPPLMPERKRVLVLLSGRFPRSNGPTDSELQKVREDLAVMNDRAKRETGESLHIITAGRMGAEREAAIWAKKNKVPVHEMAAVFAVPNEDGTTTRRLDARDRRNKRLRSFVYRALEAGCEVGVVVYGTEQERDKVEPAIRDQIARFNRQQTPAPPATTVVEREDGAEAVTAIESDVPEAQALRERVAMGIEQDSNTP